MLRSRGSKAGPKGFGVDDAGGSLRVSGLGDAEDDDGAVVFERFAPAVGDGLQDRHGGGGGGRRLDAGDRAADAVGAEGAAPLGVAFGDAVGDEDQAFVGG